MKRVDSPVLVTGAAGRIGSVGRKVTDLLLAAGCRVRAHVRIEDERALHLRALGAEVAVGDLLDIESVHRAIEGCERICFAMSVSPAYLEAAANVAVVAKHYGVEAFINLSQMTVNEMDIFNTTPSPQQKQHWLAEQILSWSGLPVVEVRPTLFMESLFLQNARTIATRNALLAPFGSGKNSAISALDVARVVAAIASEPKPHIGETYHLTGPVSQDMDAIAREVSEALHRPITYINIPMEVWKEQLTRLQLPPHVVSHLQTIAELHRANRYDRFSNDVERLTGAKPMSVGEFVERNARAFDPQV
jgi:uncharacterized protein YbjT (DUF2867 family)